MAVVEGMRSKVRSIPELLEDEQFETESSSILTTDGVTSTDVDELLCGMTS